MAHDGTNLRARKICHRTAHDTSIHETLPAFIGADEVERIRMSAECNRVRIPGIDTIKGERECWVVTAITHPTGTHTQRAMQCGRHDVVWAAIDEWTGR